MNIREVVKLLNKVIEGIVEIVLTRPVLTVKGKVIKKFIPGENGLLFVDNFRLELSNFMPINDNEDYTVIVKYYEVEIINEKGEIVQRIKGQYITDDKT